MSYNRPRYMHPEVGIAAERRAQAARRARWSRFRASHVHDRGALLPDGSRTCWGCHVRRKLEAWYLRHPDLASEVR